MHKRLLNETFITLSLSPEGPLLIKAGGVDADPTRPDMSFVRTMRGGEETFYLPGSSLKGVLRAHCERLARTVQKTNSRALSCDPLADPCTDHFADKENDKKNDKKSETQKQIDAFKSSCFVCKMFGNTRLGSHFRIEDAYPDTKLKSEERNGVAIDRVFGSVAVGPFNYETITSGRFVTRLHLKNFTLAQIGLLSLALRDLANGQIRLGFGKSRGLGVVKARVESWTLRYPLCELNGESLQVIGQPATLRADTLYGVGRLLQADEDYGYPSKDETLMPAEAPYRYSELDWMGVEIALPASETEGANWHPLGRACAHRWKEAVNHAS